VRLVRQLLPFASLLLLLIGLSLYVPDTFLTTDNFLNVFRRSSVNVIIAVGMTAIIISGGIDLSVGSMMALAGMMGAWTMQHFGGGTLTPEVMWLGTLAGIVTGTLAGFVNGALINGLKLPPFILTLGAMSTYRGIAYVMNDGQPYNVPAYKFLGDGQLLGIPISILIALAIVVVASVILKHTTLGRYTYAIGANRQATLYSGVNVNRTLVIIYTLSGALVGMASMIATSRTVSAQPTAGNGLELDIIAAVVIGGASLSGGRGTILGTIIGTLLISFLRNGCTLVGISTNVQLIVIGIIIIIAVTVDQLARAKSK
jgi:ribose/xylose/arabinose/galactoside ABC-type transport system permease subunit